MKNTCYQNLAVLLLLIAAVSSPLWAQDPPDAALETVTDIIENEKQEADKNLRDSVHENLDSINDDAKTSTELKGTQEILEAMHEPAQPPDSEAEQAPPSSEPATDTDVATPGELPEDLSFVDYLQAIPGFLQSVPDRVPFIRDRGLIFFGRTEVDFAYYSSGILSNDTGFRVRSLRAGLAKAFKYNLSMKAEIDLTDGNNNFADLYLRHRHERWGLLTVGNQRVAQTLVNQTSRISRTFMEEPLPAEAFGLSRRLALGWDLHKPKLSAHITLFGPDLNGSIGDEGFAGRVYFNPTRSRFSVFHVGVSFIRENMSRKTRFYSHPESRVTSERLVDTGIYDDITRQFIAALEVAGAKDSFMFRSEFFRAQWDRSTSEQPVFNGFYVQASWILTGESFNYTQGKFVRIRPQNPRGAWEIAARFSKIDLNDMDIKGGEEKNLTIGVNWYAPANQFRVMSNLIFVKTDKYAGKESPTIFQLRAQFHW